MRACFDEAVNDPGQAGGDEDGAQDVGALPATDLARAALVDEPQHRHDREDRYRDVDEEDPAPGDLHDQTADDRAEGPAEPGDSAEDPQSLGALDLVGEQQRDQPEGGRGGHRLAGALQEAARDEHPGVLRRAAESGGDGEHDDAGEEHAATADQVGQSTTQQE
jgi:hypothetical protein